MAGGSGAIGTDGRLDVVDSGPAVVTLRSGATLRVRRMRHSANARLQIAAGLNETNLGTEELYRQLQARWAIVDADGLLDPDTGEPVAFTLQACDGLKERIAPEAVLDAMSGDDVLLVHCVSVLRMSPDQAVQIIYRKNEADRLRALETAAKDVAEGRAMTGADLTGAQAKN